MLFAIISGKDDAHQLPASLLVPCLNIFGFVLYCISTRVVELPTQNSDYHPHRTLEEEVREQEAKQAQDGRDLDGYALGAGAYLVGEVGGFRGGGGA